MASALEQGLQLVTPEAASPQAPQAPQVQAVRPGGALGRAMDITQSARQVAAVDPMLGDIQRAMAQADAARDQASSAIQSNIAKRDQLLQSLSEERPPVPQLKAIPEAPPVVEKDPLRAFGQFLPMVAALGAFATKQPALNALNAATAMVNAAKKNDAEEEAKQRQAWKDNLEATVIGNQQLVNQYKLILDDANLGTTQKMAQIQGIAAANGDQLVLSNLQTGKIDPLVRLNDVRNQAATQLLGVYSTLENQDLQRAQLAEQRRHNMAVEAAAAAKAAGSTNIPATYLRLEAPIVEAIQKADGLIANLDKNIERLDRGELMLGPVANVVSMGRNAIGLSDSASRNYAEYKTDLEQMRNDILLMAKGTQTEGDAKRALNAVMQGSNDPKVVKQQLEKLRSVAERTKAIKTNQVQAMRADAGYPAFNASTVSPAAAKVWKKGDIIVLRDGRRARALEDGADPEIEIVR